MCGCHINVTSWIFRNFTKRQHNCKYLNVTFLRSGKHCKNPNYSSTQSRHMSKMCTKAIRRVVAVSDIHVDHPANMKYVEDWAEDQYRDDALLLAGDVTDNLIKLETTLTSLKKKFAAVFYVPGLYIIFSISCLVQSTPTYAAFQHIHQFFSYDDIKLKHCLAIVYVAVQKVYRKLFMTVLLPPDVAFWHGYLYSQMCWFIFVRDFSFKFYQKNLIMFVISVDYNQFE